MFVFDAFMGCYFCCTMHTERLRFATSQPNGFCIHYSVSVTDPFATVNASAQWEWALMFAQINRS